MFGYEIRGTKYELIGTIGSFVMTILAAKILYVPISSYFASWGIGYFSGYIIGYVKDYIHSFRAIKK